MKNYWKALLQHLQFVEMLYFLQKTLLNVGPKLFYLGIFGLELKKACVLWYFTSAPSNFSKHQILTKKEILTFETKISLIWYFRLELQKCNVVFEISTLEFGNMQSLIQK